MTFSLPESPALSATVHASASPQVEALSVDARVRPRPCQSAGLAHWLAHRGHFRMNSESLTSQSRFTHDSWRTLVEVCDPLESGADPEQGALVERPTDHLHTNG